MPDRAHLAVAGMLLALALGAVPLVVPLDFAKADPGQASAPTPSLPRLLHLRTGALVLSPGALAPSAKAARSHTVAAGETLWEISQDAGVGVEALAAANDLEPGAVLHPGRVLRLPAQDALPPSAVTAATRTTTHTVAAGETLWRISRGAGVRAEAVAGANHLSLEALLHPGQVLVLPSPDAPSRATAMQRTAPSRGPGPGLAVRAAPVRRGAPEADDVRMIQPSQGTITSRFGWRIHPIFGTREFHTGVDIANRLGTPVNAARGGVVRFVGWMMGYGRIIVVDHGDGLETAYSHLSAILVAIGDRVAGGQLLGRIGSTGWSTGPHLFFEVRRGGVPQDPARFVHLGGPPAAYAASPPTPAAGHRHP